MVIGRRQTLSGVNFGALMVLYSEIGGHVLTPFFARVKMIRVG